MDILLLHYCNAVPQLPLLPNNNDSTDEVKKQSYDNRMYIFLYTICNFSDSFYYKILQWSILIF